MRKRISQFSWGLLFLLTQWGFSLVPAKVAIFYDSNSPQVVFAANDIKTALQANSATVELKELSSLTADFATAKIVLALASDTKTADLMKSQGGTAYTSLGAQAYALRTTKQPQTSYWVFGGDTNGTMYGGLQIAENISFKGFDLDYQSEESPHIIQRGIKLNLPFDRRLPTYWGAFDETSAKRAIPHVWDLNFWKTWLDEMARYRYNVLSVWVQNPFPAMVQLKDYPLASLPNIEGFDGYKNTAMTPEKRIEHWNNLINYAHQRGFKVHLFNWNIDPDYAKDFYDMQTGKSNATTLDYFSKSITALLETYPGLDGFGISAGDHMGDFTSESRIAWSFEAYGKAIINYMKANSQRDLTIVHRGLSTSLAAIYKSWQPLRDLEKTTKVKLDFELKYSLAHMYNTLTPRFYGSQVDEAIAEKQPTWLTLRNDDFHYLNWGDPKFARDYISNFPSGIVRGWYIGSDVYHPTTAYWPKDATEKGQLEIQRNWYINMLWGRIGYNPKISDEVFKMAMKKRFSELDQEKLFTAWSRASRPLQKITELTSGTWKLDVDWYIEGCMGAGRSYVPKAGTDNSTEQQKQWKAIREMVTTSPASGSSWCSIAQTASNSCGTKKDAYTVANEMEEDANAAFDIINSWSGSQKSSKIAVNNVKQLTYLSQYYAHKIRAATFWKANNQLKARESQAKAYCWWINYSTSMDSMYETDVFRPYDMTPNWHYADKYNLEEYTDLGGTGVPKCSELVSIAPKNLKTQNAASEIWIYSLQGKLIQIVPSAPGKSPSSLARQYLANKEGLGKGIYLSIYKSQNLEVGREKMYIGK